MTHDDFVALWLMGMGIMMGICALHLPEGSFWRLLALVWGVVCFSLAIIGEVGWVHLT